MKLTPKQNMIIYCLQNGWELFTSSESKIVICGSFKHQFEFGSTVLFNLVDKGLIWQEFSNGHHYVLTPEGKKVKTKKVII